MRDRVAEDHVRSKPLGPKVRARVDLHGVSVFGPGDRRILIRWEAITEIVGGGRVTVRSDIQELTFPRKAFGLGGDDLAALLEQARSIERRPDVIGFLAGR